jgi:hypothetical protein
VRAVEVAMDFEPLATGALVPAAGNATGAGVVVRVDEDDAWERDLLEGIEDQTRARVFGAIFGLDRMKHQEREVLSPLPELRERFRVRVLHLGFEI